MSINIWEIDDAINLAPTLYSLNLDHELLTSSNDGNMWTRPTAQITWGLEGNDYLNVSQSNRPSIVIGGSGDDTYTGPNIIFEPKFSGTNDNLIVWNAIESSNGHHLEYPSYYGYINDKHFFIFRPDNPHTLIVNGLIDNGFENIQLHSYSYEPSIFKELQNYPNFVGNLNWEQYFTTYSSDIDLQDLSLTPENIEIVFDEIEKLSNLIDPNVNDGTAEFSIYGNLSNGERLNVSYIKLDPDGIQTSNSTFSYSWQTSSDGNNWSNVDTNSTYVVSNADERKSIRAIISYKDDEGFNEVVTTEIRNIPYFDNGDASFSIVGTKSVGNYLSIKTDSEDPDGTGKLSYQWQSSSDGSTWSDVSNDSIYRLQYTDSDKYYRASISYTDGDGFSETFTTDTIQIDKHAIHTSLDSLKSQLSNLSYSTSYDYTSLGYSEEFGTSSGETLYASANEIVWGLGGNDSLRNNYSTSDQYLIGGSGDDTYTISGTAAVVIYEAPNHGTNDILSLSSNYLYTGTYAASIDNKHLVAIDGNYQYIFVLDAWENTGIEKIYLGNVGYTSSYFLSLLPSLPGYLGNVSWDEIKPYAGDILVEAAKRVIDEIKSSTTTVEGDFENLQGSLKIQIAALEAQAADLNNDVTAQYAPISLTTAALAYIASHEDLMSFIGTDTAGAIKHYNDLGYGEGREITFNATQYLANYSDLTATFGTNTSDAIRHYITNGYAEGRTDSSSSSGSSSGSGSSSDSSSGSSSGSFTSSSISLSDFEALNYIASNPDLIGVFGTNTSAAATHYTNHGKSEARSLTSFSATDYLAKYSDLASAFSNDETSALKHYIQSGYAEGRNDNDPNIDITPPNKPSIQIHNPHPSFPTGASYPRTYFFGEFNSTNDNTPTFVVNAESGSTVKIYNGSTLLGLTHTIGLTQSGDPGFVSLDNDNTFITLSALDDGLYSLTATATDTAGNTSANSDSVQITIGEIVQDTSSSLTPSSPTALTDFEALNYIASHSDLMGVFGINTSAASSHYVNSGYAEGRAKDDFDEWGYLASNTDLMGVFQSNTTEAIKHFISFGQSEGRSTNIFNADSYLNNHADLKSAFGNDHTLATKHYVESGFYEGRSF